jgi:hypothetical protein
VKSKIIKIERLQRDFSVGIETVHALNGVSFDVARGEFLTIMGASGSGKSTLLNVLGALDRPTSGEYVLDGIRVGSLSKNELAQIRTREIGLRMAVGGRGQDILSQFLMEAVIVSVGGGLFGVSLGLIVAYGMGNLLDWPVVVTNQSILLSFAVCAVVGIFFGWYPARKAAGLDPIDALRFE